MLGRISHRKRGYTNYVYNNAQATGVTVYLVDTGIYTGHSQFRGRATMGANFIPSSPNTDENGHGTHCAGTIGGLTFGVYKTARLIGVKVLDARGSGTNSGLISGVQFVANNAPARSVLSMSLSGQYSSAINSAIRAAVAKGITVVGAAGNDNENADNFSPASEQSVIAVGATDQSDVRAAFSNYGPAVDIFAPGVEIVGAWIGSSTAEKTISGTSMATPYVAGLAAYLIALERLADPGAVASRIKKLATSGTVFNSAGSINEIAYNGSGA
jgi:oryzin